MDASNRDALSAVVARQRGRGRLRSATIALGAASLVAAGAVAYTLPSGVAHTPLPRRPVRRPRAAAPFMPPRADPGWPRRRPPAPGRFPRPRRARAPATPPRAGPDDRGHRRGGHPGGLGRLAGTRHRGPGDRHRRRASSPPHAGCWRPTSPRSTWRAAGSGQTRRSSPWTGRWAGPDAGPVTVSPLLAEAIAVALRAARLTDGDVDPTVGAAMNAVGYDRDFSLVPAVRPAGQADRPDRSRLAPGRSSTSRRGC